MFDNIGEKIQNWAFGLFVVDIIFVVIAGIGSIFGGELLLGLLILCIGPIVSYITTIILMGFGILVENSEDNNDILNRVVYEKHSTTKRATEAKGVHVVCCRSCGKAVEPSFVNDSICPWCGGQM